MDENNSKGCSVCGKKSKDITLLVEVQLEMFPRYLRADGETEDLNGLWKHTREYFCEECFADYSDVLTRFYDSKINKIKKSK